jgi:hypothetical protein
MRIANGGWSAKSFWNGFTSRGQRFTRHTNKSDKEDCMKPILFSTPMVQAILSGEKKMTRRVINPQPPNDVNRVIMERGREGTKRAKFMANTYCLSQYQSPMHNIDDILWVRETFWQRGETRRNMDLEPEWWRYPDFLYVATDTPPEDKKHWEKRPSIFMPKEAARLFLRVTDVRAERLQYITPEDVLREALEAEIPSDDAKARFPEGSDEMIGVHNWCKEYSQVIFRELWNKLNAKRGYGWDTNPWVWVYSFERCEKPED